jgi:hypothetical protein
VALTLSDAGQDDCVHSEADDSRVIIGDIRMNSEKIKLILGGAAGGAVVLAIIGFNWGGWVTGSTAQQMAAATAENAVVDRLALICVEQHDQDPEKDQKLKKMMDMDEWDRGDYVTKQGWATIAGEKDPDSAVSRKCAELLSKVGQ